MIRTSKGAHICFAHDRLPLRYAVVMSAIRDGRVVFAIPRGRVTLVGTTDTDYEGDPDDVCASKDDVDYLIETDPARASTMQKNLIQYLRAALPQMREGSTTLGKEMALCRAYLEILRVRMEDRLRFAVNVPPRTGARVVCASAAKVVRELVAAGERFDLVVLDDFSYARRDQAETSVLFELIAERYERKSIAITANAPFSAWNEVFPDKAMTVAAVDRLVHHSTILEMNVDSYRRR
jgi:hypothetical protein